MRRHVDSIKGRYIWHGHDSIGWALQLIEVGIRRVRDHLKTTLLVHPCCGKLSAFAQSQNFDVNFCLAQSSRL